VAAVRVLFDGVVQVDHGQLYLTAEDADVPVPDLAFAGQRNGLCGAAVPGALYLMTGLQYGGVAFTVQRHDVEPPVDDRWEDVVEVSFHVPPSPLSLRNTEGDGWAVPVPAGQYRVRYCARDFQAGWDVETADDDEPVGRYLLALWPAQPGPDRIVRQSSDAAAYWHAENGSVTEPTAASDAVAARLAAVRVHLGVIRAIHEPLVDALAGASDELHRRVARWAALRALSVAGIHDLPVLRPAVTRLVAGEQVPPPFDIGVTAVMKIGSLVPQTTVPPVVVFPWAEAHDNGDPVQQVDALLAVSATAMPDSLGAVYLAITQAAIAHGPDLIGEFLNALFEAFPELRK
jgi:hypothetical protein